MFSTANEDRAQQQGVEYVSDGRHGTGFCALLKAIVNLPPGLGSFVSIGRRVPVPNISCANLVLERSDFMLPPLVVIEPAWLVVAEDFPQHSKKAQ
jgi:hypothetical protein